MNAEQIRVVVTRLNEAAEHAVHDPNGGSDPDLFLDAAEAVQAAVDSLTSVRAELVMLRDMNLSLLAEVEKYRAEESTF